jgi:spermidine synthase
VYGGALWAIGLFLITLRERPALQLGLLAGLLTLGGAYQTQLQGAASYRSFFGVNRVAESADGRFRVLMHGTTVHGAERIRNDDGTAYIGPPQPATYYSYDGLMGEAVVGVRARRGGLAAVAAVGLGTGSLACHARAGERWTFYEIDPTVAAIARNPAQFDFLSRCTPDAPIVMGDARQTLANAADGAFDLIVLDAFSSDAVPVHLLTREAVAGYVAKLAKGGVIVFHISNRYMDLAPVLAASAASNGLVALRGFTASTDAGLHDMVSGSEVVAMARSNADFGGLAASARWRALSPDPSFREWTDDYSNVVAAIVRRLWPATAAP